MVEYIVRMEKPYDIGKALHYFNVPFVEVRRVENTSSFIRENMKTVMDNAKIPEGLQQKVLEIEGLKGTENTLEDKMSNKPIYQKRGYISIMTREEFERLFPDRSGHEFRPGYVTQWTQEGYSRIYTYIMLNGEKFRISDLVAGYVKENILKLPIASVVMDMAKDTPVLIIDWSFLDFEIEITDKKNTLEDRT